LAKVLGGDAAGDPVVFFEDEPHVLAPAVDGAAV
jgi:hypothetical protein